MSIGLTKKRELAIYLKEAIVFLTSLSEEVHKLELYDSGATSKKLKKKLVDFHHDGPTVKLLAEVKAIRHGIISPYYKYVPKMKLK